MSLWRRGGGGEGGGEGSREAANDSTETHTIEGGVTGTGDLDGTIHTQHSHAPSWQGLPVPLVFPPLRLQETS